MAENLLQICQNVSDKIQIDSPASIIGSSNEVSRHMRAAAKDEIQALKRRPEDGWDIMVKEHVFSTTPVVSGTVTAVIGDLVQDSGETFEASGVLIGDKISNTTDGSTTTITAFSAADVLVVADRIFSAGDAYEIYQQYYDLPSDFGHFVDDTLWDRTRFWKLRGPLTRSEWQKYKSSVLGDTVTNRMRWQIRSDEAATNPENKFNLDPIPVETHEVVFEYVIKGPVKSAAGAVQETWLADTDEPLLDQWLIELGIAWRSLKALGLPYDEELNEYETQVGAAIGRDGGGRILSLARAPMTSLITICNVPDTGFGP